MNRSVEVDNEEWAALHKHSKNRAQSPVDQKHKRFVQRCVVSFANTTKIPRLIHRVPMVRHVDPFNSMYLCMSRTNEGHYDTG